MTPKRLAWLLALAVVLSAPHQATPQETPRDEAARPCPADLDPGDRTKAWWCGYDPLTIVDEAADPPRLTAFQEHAYPNISAVPTETIRDLDWTCIDGKCGGLLDPDFILGRELTHVWKPEKPGDPELSMSAEQLQRAIKGRNSWLLWTGGNHGFWDHMARRGFGLADFVKLLDNRTVERSERFRKLGLINEPGMRKPDGVDKFGLSLDVPVGWEGDWPPAPGTVLPDEVPDPYVYGYSSGVMGLRLFPNPDFFYGEGAEEAQARWDPERFFSDVNYSKAPDLVRPYRIGMACSFCHVSFNPIAPPDDPSEPKWRNISSAIGAQYLKFGRAAAYDFKPDNFLWHLINSPTPGTVDTSLVATDGINNPNVINGVFGMLPRIKNSFHFEETASESAATQPTLDLSVLRLNLPELPTGAKRKTMRVLGGGEDSVGGRLALARVYFNIGSFFENWLETGNLIVGIHQQSPFEIKGLSERSVNWNVSLFRTQNMAEFLTYVSGKMGLATAPGGLAYLDLQAAERGRDHFVSHCIVCHSTKQPAQFWTAPEDWQNWVNDPDYLAEAAKIAANPDFLTGNFLATDVRYPVTEIGINSARFLLDNARTGRVWDDFSSEEYKQQAVLQDRLDLAHPYDPEETFEYAFSKQTGPGRVRPLSLMNLWATAPFLHNNTVGRHPAGANPGDYPAEEAADVSLAGRMAVFDTSIEELLHLRPRLGHGSISRTTVDSKFEMPRVVLIDFVRQQLGPRWVVAIAIALVVVALVGLFLILRGVPRLRRPGFARATAGLSVVVGLFLVIASAHLAFNDVHRLGHIPAGTPVSLVANLNGPAWLSERAEPGDISRLAFDLGKVWLFNLDSLDHPRVPELVPRLLRLNKAPDFVRDRGHDFGGRDILDANGEVVLPALSENNRRDLIEYLKTM